MNYLSWYFCALHPSSHAPTNPHWTIGRWLLCFLSISKSQRSNRAWAGTQWIPRNRFPYRTCRFTAESWLQIERPKHISLAWKTPKCETLLRKRIFEWPRGWRGQSGALKSRGKAITQVILCIASVIRKPLQNVLERKCSVYWLLINLWNLKKNSNCIRDVSTASDNFKLSN